MRLLIKYGLITSLLNHKVNPLLLLRILLIVNKNIIKGVVLMKEKILNLLKRMFTVQEIDDEYEEKKYTVQLTFAVPADNAEYAIKDMKRRLVAQLNNAWEDNECEFTALAINPVNDSASVGNVIPLINAESVGNLPA